MRANVPTSSPLRNDDPEKFCLLKGDWGCLIMKHEFSEWVRRETKRKLKFSVKALTSLQAFIALLTALARYFHVSMLKGFRIEYAVSIAYALQSIVIVVLFFFTVRLNPETNPEKDRRASDAMDRFHKLWDSLWMAWLFFYLALFLQSMLGAIGISQPVWLWEPLLNSLNNLQTVFVLFCFFVLAEPTDEKKAWEVGLALWVMFIIYALFDVVFVTVAQSFPQMTEVGNLLFRLLSGLGMGISLALLVSRFGGRYIDAPFRVLAVLYLYALIQVLYLLFRSDQYRYIQEIVTALALPLRLVLFAFVSWLLIKGKMLDHFIGILQESYLAKANS